MEHSLYAYIYNQYNHCRLGQQLKKPVCSQVVPSSSCCGVRLSRRRVVRRQVVAYRLQRVSVRYNGRVP